MITRATPLALALATLPSAGRAQERGPAPEPAPHWAYVKPVRPVVPAVADGTRVHNPIDAFVAARHAELGLEPRPPAPKRVLLRRLYLDLIGLPPTREEIDAFLADGSSGAFEKVVDRLLEDPRYGERWGRHWMDVWRYSDWYGYRDEIRESQKHIWRWRDWIIGSLNGDKGYDRMVLEMLAGDEIAPEDPDTLRATGFLARNWYRYNRDTWLESTIEHTAKAFLATTINCARCHDHFHDPITQAEYYRFRAIFEPHQVRTDRRPGEPDVDKDGVVRAYDRDLQAKTHLYIRGEPRRPDKSRALAPGVPAALRGGPFECQPVELPRLATAPHRRGFEIADDLAASQKRLTTAEGAVAKALAQVVAAEQAAATEAKTAAERDQRQGKVTVARAQLPLALLDANLAKARHGELEVQLELEALEERGAKPSQEWRHAAERATSIQRRLRLLEAERAQFLDRRTLAQARVEWERAAAGPARNKAAAKLEKAKQKLAAADGKVGTARAEAEKPPATGYAPRKVPSYPATSTGRRLALARWITSPANPLAARVAVNHIWMRHFGEPLVASVFDFGLRGSRPTHPKLLDWLAVELIDNGFRMKHLHRLIVTSSTWQMDAANHRGDAAIDPENRFLWRMNTRRMEAEVVRDSLFYVAGLLDPKMGGPEIDHKSGITVPRRSLYFQHAAEKQMQLLTTFDVAGVGECYRRSASIAPQQALAMANSALSIEKSRILAGRLEQELAKDGERSAPEAFVHLAFEQVLGRPPTDPERDECVAFLADQARRLSDEEAVAARPATARTGVSPATDVHQRARESLVLVLFNHNEFITIR